MFLDVLTALTMSALIARHVPDTLIPTINIIRKIKACDASQLSKVLQRLPSVFEDHGSLSFLTTIIALGLCQQLQHQPLHCHWYAMLLADILAAFPGDKQLDIKDSIYESKLVDDDQVDEEDSATNHNKKKIPMSLLRLPKDLQIHLFHFLKLDDLQNVQRVCRALCIVARDPLSLYSLEMRLDTTGFVKFQYLSDRYSRIKSLDIDIAKPSMDNLIGWFSMTAEVRQLIFNGNWSRSVTNISLSVPAPHTKPDVDPNQSFYFQNVQRCTLHKHISSLSLIQSYETLKHLSLLDYMTLDDNAVDQICKFQNLEILELTYTSCADKRSAPIKLSNLKDLHFTQNSNTQLVHRILTGSQPPTVSIRIGSDQWNEESLFTDVISSVENINFTVTSLRGFGKILKEQFFPLCAVVQRNGRKQKLLRKCCVHIVLEHEYFERDEDLISPIV